MKLPEVVTREEWLKARRALLVKEKAFTRERDELSASRRALPLVKVEKDYRFHTPAGEQTLAYLFGSYGQLIIQHFMFGRDWTEGCPSCSFWADNYNGVDAHLAARDTGFVVVSSAPLRTLDAYKSRLGWSFKWVSAEGSNFNADFGVSFYDENTGPGETGYNYSGKAPGGEEKHGVSVFIRLEDGTICHSYSTYARGVDMLNGTYHLLDLTPKGRGEEGLSYSMSWVKRRDEYV